MIVDPAAIDGQIECSLCEALCDLVYLCDCGNTVCEECSVFTSDYFTEEPLFVHCKECEEK